MKDKYNTVHTYGEDLFIEKKSKFIGYSKPIESEEEAIEFINEIKQKHKDANHNVSAYVFGENSNIQRYSDDGEPTGTAGIPVLEVIKKEDLRNVVVVVTRYFGGIKLGSGGLVRAYTRGAKIGLKASLIVQKVLFNRIKARIDYTLYGKVENELNNSIYIIDDVIYDDAVNIVILSEKNKRDNLESLLMNLTSGKVEIIELDEEFLSIKDGNIIK
ncbi:YigZ family protein [Clostridium sp. D2Q-11]|uniref:YigZ family protein n=1 Tax=Anaeromonas frigoriresistens TaxID=2683708 RepID=A0A942UXX8_9FIRM|nr:YigZ family protein [Anaeromonas frigoriresistens]MBS4539635.1 YigZ family protein [Anaeromonas frigoriresistens]